MDYEWKRGEGSRQTNESFGVNDSDWAVKARKSVRRACFAEATKARNAEHSRPVFACGYERGTKMPALPIFQTASSAICENPCLKSADKPLPRLRTAPI